MPGGWDQLQLPSCLAFPLRESWGDVLWARTFLSLERNLKGKGRGLGRWVE